MYDAGDVLIVGGGPVGMFTALALAQGGASVTLIECGPDISDEPRAMVYFPSTLTALEELGILDEVDKVGIRANTFGLKNPDLDFFGRVRISDLDGETYGYQIHAGQDVATRVAMAAAQRLGVKVLVNHTLTSLEQFPDHVVAKISSPDGEIEMQASWVIGCDGARSTVRKELGIEFEGHTWPERFVATNVYFDFSSLGFELANFVCDPEFMAIIAIIDNKGLWRFTYQEPGNLPVENYLDRLPEKYAYHIPKGMKYEIQASRPYTMHQRCATSLREGRVLLAGDAAHATNPCGGLGLTTGVWDGMIVSDVLGAVIRGEEGQSILDRYSEERRRVFWEVTSPGASENKRMILESDMERRKKDAAGVAILAENPQINKMQTAFPFLTIGNILRDNSRWKDASPIARAGLDFTGRVSQLVSKDD
jgi:2-polyprenyl-6-methoxyphenol hydroxylase-like FAD-dependent oxidoreductase